MFIESIWLRIYSIVTTSWRKRSILILSILTGFYFTNNLISYFLDKSTNAIILAILIILLMEISIRINLFKSTKYSIFILIINNLRIGSTYALILEAFKLGS